MSAKKRASNNPVGRPRSGNVTEDIHAAVLAVLEGRFYGDLSMDRIAIKAGVSRPALYRRYATVGETVLGALQSKGPVILPLRGSADVRKDLCSYFRAFVAYIGKDSAISRALRGALAAALVDFDLLPHFAKFIAARRQPVLDRLLVWNSSYNNTELDSILDALFGPIMYRLLIRQVPVSATQIQEIVNRALRSPNQ
jgi:AcrR family transcriptional regulator